jgi:GT2 family glycosyltransferase
VSLSVLIVSYNVRDLLLRCLQNLPSETEVIVVDNASDDGTAAAVKERFPRAQMVALNENRGFSVGVNRAAAMAHGEHFLILNPDTQPTGDAIESMEKALTQSEKNVWAMGFRQVDANGFFQLAIGPRPSLFAELVRQWLQKRLDHGNRLVAHWLDRLTAKRRTVAWVAGSCLLVRRSAFDRVAGFDERFFLFFEDIDFCLRLGQAGGKIVYEPSITLVHHRGASARKTQALAERAYRQSQLYYWEKHRGPWVRRVVALYQLLRHRGSA